MTRRSSYILAVVLAACGGDGEPRAAGNTDVETTGTALQPGTEARPESPALQDTAGPGAAAAVLESYYEAIGARDYARAYALWSDSGRASNQTFDAFRAGFAETRTVEAHIGTPGRIEGAAGSRYIEIPVTVRATTTGGEPQCFRGDYTLRRSEVDGATAEQRQWRIHSADLEKRPAEECARGPGGAAADSVRNLAEAFGARLAAVSLLAPEDVVRRDIRQHYGAFVTQELLERWLADPADAPGRKTSSPWPDRLEVLRIQRLASDRYRIVANIVYTASSEGGQAAVDRQRVTLEATRTSVGWRISGWA